MAASLLAASAGIGAALAHQPKGAGPATPTAPPEIVSIDHGGGPSVVVWPAYGQAAYVESGQSQVHASPDQHAAPIASVAKVMTAYLVLRDHPLALGEEGPAITLTDADAADTAQRSKQGQSVVAVVAGERLTELQALEALLLPSANNIAAVLAQWDAGSISAFLTRMNAAAQSLGMADTHYTDPSGYDATTVSTAADQLRIVDQAMLLPVFASIVATPSVELPVAGTVRNTDTLLGRNGFIGVKTGSDDAAGGCFAFRVIRWIDGKQTTITGVVLGQPGGNKVSAGLDAADAMVNRIAGRGPQLRLPGVRARPNANGVPGND